MTSECVTPVRSDGSDRDVRSRCMSASEKWGGRESEEGEGEGEREGGRPRNMCERDVEEEGGRERREERKKWASSGE